MIRLLSFAIFCSASLQAAQPVPCHPLSGDLIRGRDLASVVPQLAFLPPDLPLGYAPAPGVQRLFSVSQLQQLAKRYQIDSKIKDPVCFGWTLRTLAKQDIAAAIARTLAGRQFEVEVVDQSKAQVPEGELIFPLQALTAQSDKPAPWSGSVVYAGGRKFATWALVRVLVHETHLVALRSFAAGEVIDASALKEVLYVGPLLKSQPLQSSAQAAGQSMRWGIAAGVILTANMLAAPLDVAKEELVTVRAVNGSARVETQGQACDPGYVGAVIRVKNPATGRVFRARIDGRGMVTVVPGGSVGLVVEARKS